MEVLLRKLKLSGIVSDQLLKNVSVSNSSDDNCNCGDDCDCDCAC